MGSNGGLGFVKGALGVVGVGRVPVGRTTRGEETFLFVLALLFVLLFLFGFHFISPVGVEGFVVGVGGGVSVCGGKGLEEGMFRILFGGGVEVLG